MRLFAHDRGQLLRHSPYFTATVSCHLGGFVHKITNISLKDEKKFRPSPRKMPNKLHYLLTML